MKKLLITSFVLFIVSHGFSQQFYFPNELYSDSTAFAKAMPGLAKQVIANFHKENNPVYFFFMPRFQIVADDYDGAAQTINESQIKYPLFGKALLFKENIYALAKTEQKKTGGSFDKLYRNKFMVLYNQLPEKDLYFAVYPYTTNVNQYNEKLQKLKSNLKQKNTDSIDFGDAKSLCLTYYYFKTNSEVLPSAKIWLVELENKNFILHSRRQNFLAEYPERRQYDWWQADWEEDSLPGISLDKAYDYLKGRQSKPAIVAIIDEGIDTAHEDLIGHIWTNTKEIPGNGIDDDGNGYVDDIHGWNFIAEKTNKMETGANYTRLYLTWKNKFENIDREELSATDKVQYDMYLEDKKEIFEQYHYFQLARLLTIDSAKSVIDSSRFIHYLDNLLLKYSQYKDSLVSEPIPFSSFSFSKQFDITANDFFSMYVKRNLPLLRTTLESFIDEVKSNINSTFLNDKVFFDEDAYDTTKKFEIISEDDLHDFTGKHYGSPGIDMPNLSITYTTFIAGIIAANRNNNIGMKGICDSVLIMPLVNSDGKIHGWGKDFILAAVHYAVDNGASIINMSFNGTPETELHVKELREAFDYAAAHNVLVVNSAGNEGATMDNEKYLMGQGIDGKENNSYIRVGATTALLNDGLVANFSNFGGNSVDIFAPGEGIYSNMPGNKYMSAGGTSFSGPVVAGVAALLKSYFPSLTANEIKDILMKSVYKPDPDLMVIPPKLAGYHYKIPFSQMSKSGGIVNAYNAVKMADEVVKNKK